MTDTTARHRVSTILLLAGLVMMAVTAIVAYLARTVLNEAAFSARVVSAVERPAMAQFVALQIAEGVVAANRDLTGVKPIITTFAEAVVRSGPFKALVGRAATEAHRVMLSQGAKNVMLSVPDVGVLLRGTLESVSPELAAKVPPDVRTVIDTRITGDIAGKVVSTIRVANRIRLLARIGILLGMVLVITAVAVAPRRRQAFLDTSIGLLAIAAVLGLIVPLGRVAVIGAIPDPLVRGAVSDVWVAFAGGFRGWAIGIATVALMLMAGAAAFLERVVLRETLRRGVDELTARQPTKSREAIRVLCLFVIGMFGILAPVATLVGAVTIAGALVLAMAVYQLVLLLAPPAQHSDEPAPRLNPALGIAVICVALTAAGLGALTLMVRYQPQQVLAATGPLLECNGAAALCDRPFDQITFPGAHNAQGSATNPSWLFPNQDQNVAGLLRRGIRAFMIDVWDGNLVGDRVKTVFAKEEDRAKFEKAIGPEAFAAAMRIRDRLVGAGGPTAVYMCHGFCELGALPVDTALAQIKEFLVNWPSDVVMLILEDYVPPKEVEDAFTRNGLMEYMYLGPSRGPFPTLRQLIATNQRLIVMGEHDTGGLPWYHPAWETFQETPYTFHEPDQFSCGKNRGDDQSPLFLINHWIESSPSPKPSNAVIVNAESVLVARANECRRARGRVPNVIAVDFAATGDIVRAAAVLNGLEKPLASDSAR